MINKIFIDSSVLVEALKGNKISFYHQLISEIDNECFINETVLSEYLYYFLAINGDASPRTLQEQNKIEAIINSHLNEAIILENFSFIKSEPSFINIVPSFMAKYNLLPNDAIILATCKIHSINQLASHDTDFIIPCKVEGIELLRED